MYISKTNISLQRGQTPLHLAARKNSVELARVLLAHGARKSARQSVFRPSQAIIVVNVN